MLYVQEAQKYDDSAAHYAQCFLTLCGSQIMGVGRIFSRGTSRRDFSKIFPGEAKSDEIFFPHSELRTQPVLAEIFKIQGGMLPLVPLPMPTVTDFYMNPFKHINGPRFKATCYTGR